jgi:hypothetical protein
MEKNYKEKKMGKKTDETQFVLWLRSRKSKVWWRRKRNAPRNKATGVYIWI